MRILRAVVVGSVMAAAMACLQYEVVYARPSATMDLAALKARVLELTLEERRKAGLEPSLVVNNLLSQTATEHSDDMVARHYFDHKDPDGNDSLRRVIRHDPGYVGALGENIVAHKFSPASGFDPETFAHIIVKAWLKSPGHKRTMLLPLFRETGIGIAMSKDEVFVTQLFAGPVPGMASWQSPQEQRTSALTPQP